MTVACSCGGKASANIQYQVIYRDGSGREPETVGTKAEAVVLRAAAGGKAVITTVPKTS